jgi:hypothetical protein
MKAAIITLGSTGPLPWVRPRGPTSPLAISRSRMMEVSAWEPQPLDEQSRGVPSATAGCQFCLLRTVPLLDIPDVLLSPGMVTPLAPSIEVTTQWAEAPERRARTVTEYCILTVRDGKNMV